MLKKSISQRREEKRAHERLGMGEGETYDRGQIVRTKVQSLGGIIPGVYSADREPQSVTSYDRPKIAGRIQVLQHCLLVPSFNHTRCRFTYPNYLPQICPNKYILKTKLKFKKNLHRED